MKTIFTLLALVAVSGQVFAASLAIYTCADSEALVEKPLLTGAKKGFLKIQNRGEAFFSEKYNCELSN